MSNQDAAEIISVIRAAMALADRIRKLRGDSGSSLPSGSDGFDSILPILAAASGGKDISADHITGLLAKPPEEPVLPVKTDETELTNINAALGQTLGKILDGKKTAIGIVGLLGTTILPIFFPQLAPIVAGIKAVAEGANPDILTTGQQLIGAAGPIFGGTAIWGVLGKVDKWIKQIKKK